MLLSQLRQERRVLCALIELHPWPETGQMQGGPFIYDLEIGDQPFGMVAAGDRSAEQGVR